MKTVIVALFGLCLCACNGDTKTEQDIAKIVSENKNWPMQVEGKFSIDVARDSGGGVDRHIFGTIGTSEDSSVFVYSLESLLIRNHISDGDRVSAMIKPSDFDGETYEIVSIQVK